jgi:hypothetical protein
LPERDQGKAEKPNAKLIHVDTPTSDNLPERLVKWHEHLIASGKTVSQ